jgi:hypothetical protein
VISEYAESLAGRLSFDRSLSQCVRQEVEDHLREAVAADASGDVREAERRAIAKFGDPQIIAAQIAAVALARQTRKIGVTILLVIAGVFLAMKIRIGWYELTQWALCEDARALAETVSLIDRSAFWFALVSAVAGWAYIGSRRRPASFQSSYRRQLYAFLLLCTLAAGGIAASVVCDGVLTALRLSGWEVSVDFLIPIVSMLLEIVCAAVLVYHIRRTAGRVALASQAFRRKA